MSHTHTTLREATQVLMEVVLEASLGSPQAGPG